MTYVELISTVQDFLVRFYKSMIDGIIIDLCSRRILNGVGYQDKLPNKHYVSKEKIWEFMAGDNAYMIEMFKEQLKMGLITEEDVY